MHCINAHQWALTYTPAPRRSRAEGRLLHPQEWRAYLPLLPHPSPIPHGSQGPGQACWELQGGVAGVCGRMAVAAKVGGSCMLVMVMER